MCGESRMHGVEWGKTWRLFQRVTYHYWKSDSAAVDAGWAKAGITCVTKPAGDNLYFKDGKEMTRNEALDYLKANFKQIRDIP